MLLANNVSRRAAAEHGLDPIDTADLGVGLWKPLQHPDSIRLFTLSRDPASGLLGFSLSEHRLSEQPEYYAVSYCWGRIGNVSIIESLHGHRALRRNLNAILHNLETRICKAELATDTLFWVDSICINQESLAEKAQQVRQIGTTFKGAKSVLVWLGTHQDGGLSCLESIFGDLIMRPSWSRLSTHMYWTRVWIIQEFVLAQNIVLFDEAHWIEGSRLLDRVTSIPSDAEVLAGNDGSVRFGPERYNESLMGRILYRRLRQQAYGNLQIESECSLVAHFREQSCTDLRDKVYALLSMSDWTPNRFHIDYSISIGDLFWRTVVSGSKTHNTFSQIRHVMSALNLKICHLIPSNAPSKLHASIISHRPHETEDFQSLGKVAAFNDTYESHIEVKVDPYDLQRIHLCDSRTFYRGGQLKYTVIKGQISADDWLLHIDPWPFALLLHHTGISGYRVSGIASMTGSRLSSAVETSLRSVVLTDLYSSLWSVCRYGDDIITVRMRPSDFLALLMLYDCAMEIQHNCLYFDNPREMPG